MYRGRGRRRIHGHGMLYILAIHGITQFAQLERKPPITAALVLTNTIVFLRPGRLDALLPTIHEVCLNPHLIVQDLDVKRLFLSAFYHIDETHLVYNMLSLLWKGVQLEGSMGSKKFAWMVGILLGLSHSIVVLASKGLEVFADYPDAFQQCAVGFSGVLFALKVVLNWNSPTYTNVYGVLVPARHAAWAELLFVQMLIPEASFLGHLSGILAGLLYIHVPQLFSGGGTFRGLFRMVGSTSPLLWPFRLLLRPFHWWGGRTFGRGVVGTTNNRGPFPDGSGLSSQGAAGVAWRCSACTYDNVIHVNECEMCGALRSSMNNYPPSAPPWSPSEATSVLSMEDMRRARLARFSR